MPAIIRLVDEHDVDRTDTEAGQALIERAHDRVGAEVDDSSQVGIDYEAVVTPRRAESRRDQEATHLRRQHRLRPRSCRKRLTEPRFRQTEPVVRGGVEVADPALPRRVDRGDGCVVGDRGVEVANGGSSKPELGHRHARAPRQRVPPHGLSASIARSEPLPGRRKPLEFDSFIHASEAVHVGSSSVLDPTTFVGAEVGCDAVDEREPLVA